MSAKKSNTKSRNAAHVRRILRSRWLRTQRAVSDFAPVREHLAREREWGRGFTAAWRRALATVEDKAVRDALVDTRRAWRDAYNGRPDNLDGLTRG